MTVDKELISRLEHLARLELSAEEKQRIQHDLNEILKMVEKLNELDTDGVAPLVYLSEAENVAREDEVRHQVDRAAALKNAPQQDGTYIKVPKVIG
ncbi:MAG: Asp-tRNA(Asn)/Glu-tRNA(Gln) amidotransferase subunit GatC [Bacteroidota bacterium]